MWPSQPTRREHPIYYTSCWPGPSAEEPIPPSLPPNSLIRTSASCMSEQQAQLLAFSPRLGGGERGKSDSLSSDVSGSAATHFHTRHTTCVCWCSWDVMEGILCTTGCRTVPASPFFFPPLSLSLCPLFFFRCQNSAAELTRLRQRTRQDKRPDAEKPVAHIDGLKRTEACMTLFRVGMALVFRLMQAVGSNGPRLSTWPQLSEPLSA
ncbi:hypothetical protein V8C34DRAFT_255696 [Trichoderma compactum]